MKIRNRRWGQPKLSERQLVNNVPFDGCLLVFNANQANFRARCSELSRLTGIRIRCTAITGASREVAHTRVTNSDLYIWIEEKN